MVLSLKKRKSQDLQAPKPPRPCHLFFLLAGLSGSCGLAYEIIYSRLFSNYFGDTFLVSGIILSSVFMGISFGAWKSGQFINRLAYIEYGIGLYAFCVPTLFSFYGFYISDFGGSLTLKIYQLVVLLFIPSFLIGSCVPLFSQYIHTFGRHKNFAFAAVYATYNFGAFLSVIAIEFILLRQWGILWTSYFIGIINIFIGTTLWLSKNQVKLEVFQKRHFHRPVAISLFLASFASGIFQLYVLQISSHIFGPLHENLAIILLSAILGIVIGSLLAKNKTGYIQKTLSLEISLIASAFACLLFLLLLSSFISTAFSVLHISYLKEWPLITKTLLLTIYPLPLFITFGTWLPLVVKYHKNHVDISGSALALSSLANGLGMLFMFLLLYRYLTLLQIGIFIFALLTLSYLILNQNQKNHPRKSPKHSTKNSPKNPRNRRNSQINFARVIQCFFIAGVFIPGIFYLWPQKTLLLGEMALYKYKSLEMIKENFKEVIFYKSFDQNASIISFKDGKKMLILNGYHSLTFHPPYSKTVLHEMIVGASPVLFSQDTKQALVFGLGSGITAGATAKLYDSTKVVEINPAMLNIPQHFKEENQNIIADKNVDIALEDGISTLLNENKFYDAIINTVTSPKYYSSSKLYTQEFYQIVLSRLKKGGVYSSYFSLNASPGGISVMLNTLESTFDKCRYFILFTGYFNVVCGMNTATHPSTHRGSGLSYMPPEIIMERTRRSYLMKQFRKFKFQDDLHKTMRALEIDLSDNFFQRSLPDINTLNLPLLEFMYQSPFKVNVDAEKIIDAITKNIEFRQTRDSSDSNGSEWKYACRTMQNMSTTHFSQAIPAPFEEFDCRDSSMQGGE